MRKGTEVKEVKGERVLRPVISARVVVQCTRVFSTCYDRLDVESLFSISRYDHDSDRQGE